MPNSNGTKSEFDSLSEAIWIIRDALDDIRKDQLTFFEQMISLTEKLVSAVEKMETENNGSSLNVDRIAVAAEDTARSLRKLEDRFIPRHFDNEP